jgi:hypothetical protein
VNEPFSVAAAEGSANATVRATAESNFFIILTFLTNGGRWSP